MTSSADETPTQHVADLDLAPNEASGLLRVEHAELLERRGWDTAFWSVLDEVDVADCIALIGHRAGTDLTAGWECSTLRTRRHGDEGPADDAEAVARHAGWVYVFGSQHGGKAGPIRRREQWVARFRETDVDSSREPVPLTVRRTRFALHRLINDALRDSDLDLLPMGEATRAAFIDGTRAQLAGGEDEGLVRPDDWTLNVEGAAFTGDGLLLIGLRFPVSVDGLPVLVGLSGCDRLFDGGEPEVTHCWALDAVGRGGALAGVRDLCLLGDDLHVVTGNLDSRGKGSAILADHPGGRDTVNTHFAMSLTTAQATLTGRVVREFPEHPRIEGIADGGRGRFFYVSDEDEIVHLRCTPLLAGLPAQDR
jgi:hypothetical protein